MNRLLFIVFAFIMFSQPLFAQGSHEDNMYIKRMREQYELRQKQQSNFQKPMDDSVLTMLGRWAWGPCLAVDIEGDYAYIGNGPTIHILDIHNPENPEIIGAYDAGGLIHELDVRGEFLYCSVNGYLIILNISVPQHPVLIGSVDASSWRLAVTDSFAYMLSWGCFLQIIDISNPANPYLRGGTLVVGDELPTNVVVNGKTVYANGYGGYGFSMIDVTDPDNPVSYSSETEKSITAIATYDTLLLVSTLDDSLLVYSIKSPTQPFEIGRMYFEHGNPWVGMEISDNILYATATGGGVYSIDISNPNNPFERDYFTSNNLSHWYYKIHKGGGTLIVSLESGMMLINAENPDSLMQISFFATAQYYNNIKIKDDYLFICSGLSGLWIIDISNPLQPKEVSNINTGSSVEDVVIDSQYAYVVCRNPYISNYLSDTSRGLFIIDISDIQQPILISHYIGIIKNWFNFIDKHNEKVFITQSNYSYSQTDSIIEIINVSNPYNPTSMGIYRKTLTPYDIEVNDSLIYLATDHSEGMHILNYENPNQMKLVSTFQSGSMPIWGLVIRDTLIYVNRIDTFFVLKDNNNHNFQILGRTDRIDNSYSQVYVCLEGDFVYWAENKLGIVNIKNPYNPVQKIFPLGIQSVSSKSNIIYVSIIDYGIQVYKNNLVIDVNSHNSKSENFVLLQNYPNPFNNSTTISYEINRNGVVDFKIYNILGKEVVTLKKGTEISGVHTLQWNGRDKNGNQTASGVYLCRLNVNGKTVVKKILYLK